MTYDRLLVRDRHGEGLTDGEDASLRPGGFEGGVAKDRACQRLGFVEFLDAKRARGYADGDARAVSGGEQRCREDVLLLGIWIDDGCPVGGDGGLCQSAEE